MKSGIFAGRWLCVGGLFALSAPVYAIDCAKAGSAVERLICADRKTVSADAELNRAYAAILKKAPDSEIRSMLVEGQKRWVAARNQTLDMMIREPDSLPEGMTVGQIARALIRNRVADFNAAPKGSSTPRIIANALGQRAFLEQFSGGEFAGFSTSCDVLPRDYTGYDCFAVRHYQNKDRICSVDEYWASGSGYTKRYVTNVVNGEPKVVASCSFSSSDEACSDTAGQTKWNTQPRQPPNFFTSRPLPKIDGEVHTEDDYKWVQACLSDAGYVAAGTVPAH